MHPCPTLTVSPQARSRSCRSPFRVGFRSGLHLTPSRVRQCIRPYRVHHFLNYGLVIRFRLLPTPSLDDAVAFSYGQPVLCPMGTSTPLIGAHSQAHEGRPPCRPTNHFCP